MGLSYVHLSSVIPICQMKATLLEGRAESFLYSPTHLKLTALLPLALLSAEITSVCYSAWL